MAGDEDTEGPVDGDGPPEWTSMDALEVDSLASDDGPDGDGGGAGGDPQGREPGFLAGEMVMEELGAHKSKAVSKLLDASAAAREAWGELAGPRLLTTGTAGCSACSSPDHDRLMFSYWRGEITADEAGRDVGVGGDRWTQHQRDHVPNYQVMRELARIGAGADMRRLLVDLRDEALKATDEFDRMVLLRQNVVVLRATLLALVSRGITSSAQQAQAIRGLTHEIQGQARELYAAEKAAAEWAATMRRERQGDGWSELDKFKRELEAVLSRDPELGARVNDLLEAEAKDDA